MSCRRLLTSLSAGRPPCVVAHPNIRAIHVLPTISTCLGGFSDVTIVDRHRRLLLTDLSYFQTLKRYKSGKKKRKPAQDEESDDDDDEEDEADLAELAGQSTKVIAMTVNSMRIDLVVKAGMGMSRAKAEIALYESKIRVNGEKVTKKSYQAKIGDVIDLVRGPSPNNPDFIVVSRLVILTAMNDNNAYKVKFTRDKSLVIENYDDVWTPVES